MFLCAGLRRMKRSMLATAWAVSSRFVGVDEVELYLVGIGTERVAGIQRLQQLDGIQVVACIQL